MLALAVSTVQPPIRMPSLPCSTSPPAARTAAGRQAARVNACAFTGWVQASKDVAGGAPIAQIATSAPEPGLATVLEAAPCSSIVALGLRIGAVIADPVPDFPRPSEVFMTGSNATGGTSRRGGIVLGMPR